jgi:hypothetical protein
MDAGMRGRGDLVIAARLPAANFSAHLFRFRNSWIN